MEKVIIKLQGYSKKDGETRYKIMKSSWYCEYVF